MTCHPRSSIRNKRELLRAAIDLGAQSIKGRSDTENALIDWALLIPRTSKNALASLERSITQLDDPLGKIWIDLRAPEQRRKVGSYYTPQEIVKPMISWLLKHGAERIVDAACGSGRFAAQAALLNPLIKLIALDNDPVATLITRATLNVLGAKRACVFHGDFLTARIRKFSGRTGFVSNPPYVRFQELSKRHKALGQVMARELDHEMSGLSGLHAYFFLGVARGAQEGDIGCFLTSAEWTENAYGKVVRDLLLNGLGGESVRIVDPKVFAFDGVKTTAAIACFRVGAEAQGMHIGQVTTLGGAVDLDCVESMQFYDRGFLLSQSDWKQGRRSRAGAQMQATPTIGDLFRVSRGTATGANKFFVMTSGEARLAGLVKYALPVLSSARELPRERHELRGSDVRKVLISLPKTLDRKSVPDVDRYLRGGEQPDERSKAICDRTLARTRNPWWSIEPPSPPIVVSYMARKPPGFYLNRDDLPILNIAHGLYPKRKFTAAQLKEIVQELNANSQQFLAWGRTYHGNLKKFEPSEIQALPFPNSLAKYI
jgi:SAM-dependent methyltransferase